ncbi:hypothetical protein ACQ4PT_066354 [Festuca glaucescens]
MKSLLLVVLAVAAHVLLPPAQCQRLNPEIQDTGGLSRGGFPAGFVFGTAASAYQVEGMAKQGGRGPSIWDAFIAVPGTIAGNGTADVTVDEYHRYKEDVNIMKNMGFDAYRFSISWSRIFPEGTGKVNQEGVDYYNRLINYMLQQGITPYANLYHYDLPLTLHHQYLGWLSQKIVGAFADYADFCFKVFGDRVKNWFTFNEPRVVAALGFLQPIIHGRYPDSMVKIVGHRLPAFSADESRMVKGSIDYVGINQYTSYYMKDPGKWNMTPVSYQDDWHVGFAYERNGVPIGSRANSDWLYIVPWGINKAVTYVKERYGNPTMILSENGMDQPGNVSLADGLRDTVRVRYYRDYISELKKAIDNGARVVGYFAWSLLDNFEWRLGYTARFGIVYVDYKTLKRYPKDSAFWFKNMLSEKKKS